MSMPPPQHGKAPILECVREGFAFIGRDWRLIAPIALIGAAVLSPIEVWSSAAQARNDLGTMLLASLAGVLVQIPVLAAFYRRAASRGTEPLALLVGRDELNLAGATFSIGFVFLIVFFVGMFIVMLSLASLMVGSGLDPEKLRNLPPQEQAAQFLAALGNDGKAVFIGLALALTGFALWLSARLSLAYPATIAEGRMQIFSTWGWTKGNATSIAASLILLGLGAIVLIIAATLLPSIAVGLAFGEAAMTTPGTPASWIMTFVSAAAGIAFFHAPYAAMMAYMYRGLRPQ